MARDLLRAETHFEFGKNWSDYSSRIDEAEIEQAKKGILALIPAEALQGASFLDIGSGSGLHSLAAHQLGAGEITAIDIDSDSVDTTRRVLARFGAVARVERMSIFDSDTLGTYDIVYSWGVLHHTGDLWQAVRKAAEHVKPGGLFAVALYRKTPMCGAWTVEKRIYTASPKLIRWLLSGIYGVAKLIAMPLAGKNPVTYVRDYHKLRGMSYWHDVHDWVGGYPYQSSTPKETEAFFAELGFKPVKRCDRRPAFGLFGTYCAEYVFRRGA
jgi:2-polyprenyl-6-hydroxyphenyl methylase/3-demethylubiquinone-9 3-methyltransferase